MLSGLVVMSVLAGCGGPGARVDGVRPAGYVTHQGFGFTIAAPPGMGGLAGEGPGGKPGADPDGTRRRPAAAIYIYVQPPHVHTIEQAISDADQLQRAVNSPRNVHQRIESLRVPGAAAKLVTASFLTEEGPAKS